MQEQTNPVNAYIRTKFITIMELKEQFEKAAADSKNLSERPGNDVLLQLYSLYKQGSEGDVNIGPPSNPFDFVAKAKYEAWAGLKGKSTTDAMTEYVELIKKLKG
jgi:diazepam-binding inhibitor (GABA receptor modulating acyl-CoA-binding protein)